MAIWKLEPVNPNEHHWQESTYAGHVIVRARDEADARVLAADAFGIVSEMVLGVEAMIPWNYDWLVTCERTGESDFDEEGPDTILGPEDALAKARPSS